MTSVAEAYAQLRHQPSDIREHLPRFVDLVVNLDAQKVCELGVRTGVSTVAWLEGLRATGGHLYAVDINPAPFEHQSMTFLQGDDCDPAVHGAIPDDLDLLFIDSSHLHIHTVREIELYVPKLAPGGAVVFHDVDVERFEHHPDDEIPYPVRTAVEQAAHEGDWQVDWITGSYGLAVCWPPTEEIT